MLSGLTVQLTHREKVYAWTLYISTQQMASINRTVSLYWRYCVIQIWHWLPKKKKGQLKKSIMNGIFIKRAWKKVKLSKRDERNGQRDHRCPLIRLDNKVRLRINDMSKSCLSSFSVSLSLFPPIPSRKGEQGLLLVMWPCLKLCVAIVKSKDLFIFYTQLLIAK